MIATIPTETMLTRAELQARWRVSRPTIFNYEARHILRPIRIGGIVRYRLSDILEVERTGAAAN